VTFKIGDVVRLKSGGVQMCVTAHHALGEGTGTVSVTWLTTLGEPRSYCFDERLVMPASDAGYYRRENGEPEYFHSRAFKTADGRVYEHINGNWERTSG